MKNKETQCKMYCTCFKRKAYDENQRDSMQDTTRRGKACNGKRKTLAHCLEQSKVFDGKNKTNVNDVRNNKTTLGWNYGETFHQYFSIKRDETKKRKGRSTTKRKGRSTTKRSMDSNSWESQTRNNRPCVQLKVIFR